MKRIAPLLAALAFWLVLPLAAAAQDGAGSAPLEEKTYNGTRYITGGVGIAERQSLQPRPEGYNLKLSFALRSGKFLGIAEVTVEDAGGATVLEATTEGPWLYAELPPGRYTVRAAAQGETKEQTVQLPPGEGYRELIFYW